MSARDRETWLRVASWPEFRAAAADVILHGADAKGLRRFGISLAGVQWLMRELYGVDV